MARTLAGIFFILHGLVHIWYIVLARKLVPFQPEMGWSGKSWLFTGLIGDGATRNLATLLLLLATVGFSAGGVGFLAQQPWSRSLLLVSAGISGLVLVFFWDGGFQRIAQKGLIGLLINLGILMGMWFLP